MVTQVQSGTTVRQRGDAAERLTGITIALRGLKIEFKFTFMIKNTISHARAQQI